MATTKLFDNSVSTTLLIPLIVRSLETERPDGLFRDTAAQDIVAKIPGDAFTFSMNPFMRIGTAVRIRYFDDLAKNFLHHSERPVVVQLG